MSPFIQFTDNETSSQNEQLTVNNSTGSDRVVLLFLVSIGSIAPLRQLFTSNPNLGLYGTLFFTINHLF